MNSDLKISNPNFDGQNFDENLLNPSSRRRLNLQFGNITGIPSGLGLTDGRETTNYYFKKSNSGGLDAHQNLNSGSIGIENEFQDNSQLMGTIDNERLR